MRLNYLIIFISVFSFQILVAQNTAVSNKENSQKFKDLNLPKNVELIENNTAYSKITGGDWDNIDTWENGTIPGENQDVVIKGNVLVNSIFVCKNLIIDEKGSLKIGSKINTEITSLVKENLYLSGNLYIVNNNELHVNGQIQRLTEKSYIDNCGVIKIGDYQPLDKIYK